jgi:hypothetical protein
MAKKHKSYQTHMALVKQEEEEQYARSPAHTSFRHNQQVFSLELTEKSMRF